jgi:hypothetical protein
MGQSWHCRLLSALSPAYNRRYRAQAMKQIKRAESENTNQLNLKFL